MFSSIEHFWALRSKRKLTAITRRRAAFAAHKVVQIVSLRLLYVLIPVFNFLRNGWFSQSGSQIPAELVTFKWKEHGDD